MCRVSLLRIVTLNKARTRTHTHTHTHTHKHTHTHTHTHTHKPHASTEGRRVLYLQTINTDNRQSSMPTAGYKPAVLLDSFGYSVNEV